MKMGQTNDNNQNYLKIEKGMNDILYRGNSSQPYRWFTYDEGIDCGMENSFIYASVDEINFYVIEKTGKSLAFRGPGDSSFVKMIKDGASGKDSSPDSVSGVKLLKFEFELKP